MKRVLSLLNAGSTVVVIGVGGLGHLAIAALKAISPARIIAVDRAESGRTLAAELGADLCLPSDGGTAESMQQAVGKVDAVLDFVGHGVTIALAAPVIRPLGHIVIVGRGHGIFEFKDRTLPYGALLSTTFGGSRRELMELVALTNAGKIRPHITAFPLSEVQADLDKLRRGGIVGRAVIRP